MREPEYAKRYIQNLNSFRYAENRLLFDLRALTMIRLTTILMPIYAPESAAFSFDRHSSTSCSDMNTSILFQA